MHLDYTMYGEIDLNFRRTLLLRSTVVKKQVCDMRIGPDREHRGHACRRHARKLIPPLLLAGPSRHSPPSVRRTSIAYSLCISSSQVCSPFPVSSCAFPCQSVPPLVRMFVPLSSSPCPPVHSNSLIFLVRAEPLGL